MEIKENYFTSEYILMNFNQLGDKEMVSVLYDALDFMEQYNGRSKSTCIMMAMGYENIEGERDTWTMK